MNTASILPDRLAKLDMLQLLGGDHQPPSDIDNPKACLLEAVAWLVGEWGDRPACACPVAAAFGRRLNDAITDPVVRTRLLLPFAKRLVGSHSTREVNRRRALVATDWVTREAAPIMLRVAGMTEEADHMTALAPITSPETMAAARPVIADVRAATHKRRLEAWKKYSDAAADADAYAAAAAAYAAATATDAYAAATDAAAYAAAYAAAGADAYAAAADAAAYAAVYAAAADVDADASRRAALRCARDEIHVSAAACLGRMLDVMDAA